MARETMTIPHQVALELNISLWRATRAVKYNSDRTDPEWLMFVERYGNGTTYSEIGRQFNITRHKVFYRVRKVLINILGRMDEGLA